VQAQNVLMAKLGVRPQQPTALTGVDGAFDEYLALFGEPLSESSGKQSGRCSRQAVWSTASSLSRGWSWRSRRPVLPRRPPVSHVERQHLCLERPWPAACCGRSAMPRRSEVKPRLLASFAWRSCRWLPFGCGPVTRGCCCSSLFCSLSVVVLFGFGFFLFFFTFSVLAARRGNLWLPFVDAFGVCSVVIYFLLMKHVLQCTFAKKNSCCCLVNYQSALNCPW
jgi:hypothetical protein